MKKGDKLCDISGKEYTVSKVGRKYFYCEGIQDKFCQEKLKSIDSFRTIYLFTNIQEVKDKAEKRKIENRISNTIKSYVDSGVSLDALRQINTILDNDKKANL